MSYAHLVDRSYVFMTPALGIEPIAMLANEPDPRAAHLGRRLRLLMLGLGFDEAVLLEYAQDEHRMVLASSHRFDRFVDALDALDAKSRDALALTAERRAALGSLDELRALFAAGDLAAARGRGAHCFRALEAAFAATPAGEAKIKRPIVRDSTALARLCEIALATFLCDPNEALGRAQQLLWLAADLGGGPREPHETRDDRGRRTAFTSPAATGFEVIELPFPVVHPSMWSAVAAALETTVDAARARLCGHEEEEEDDDDDFDPETMGPRALAPRLGRELLVRRIPVVPEDERPTLYFPKRDAYAGTTTIDDPLSLLYASLRGRVRRIERLLELGAPDILVDIAVMATQRIVEKLASAASTPFDPSALDGWGSPGPKRSVPLWRPARDGELGGEEPSDTPPSILWLTDDRICVARNDVASIVSLSERRTLRTIELGPVQLQACDDAGRLVLTTANSMMSEGGVVFGFGCFDAETAEWLTLLPDHVPAVSFGKNDPEDGVLFEHRRGSSFVLACDRPTAMCFSRGNRAALLSGDYSDLYFYGIRSTVSCIEEVSVEWLERRRDEQVQVLLADGTCVDEHAEPERRERRMYEAAPCAIAMHGGRWRYLLPSLHVGDVDRTYFRLGFAIDAASFSPNGERLIILGDELSVIDIERRAVLWRASLDALER